MRGVSPHLPKRQDTTLAPVPLTDDEVRLLLLALEMLRDAQAAPGAIGGGSAEVSHSQSADITALHRHLTAEAHHRRNCHQGRQSRLVRAAAKPTGSKSGGAVTRSE